jgi:hypothetical protein
MVIKLWSVSFEWSCRKIMESRGVASHSNIVSSREKKAKRREV